MGSYYIKLYHAFVKMNKMGIFPLILGYLL